MSKAANMRSATHRSLSPNVAPSNSHHHHPPPQNSRDKKRSQVSNKIREMIDSFADNNLDHFSAQLCAIHCDLNLVMRADPYHGPLDDSPAEISRLTLEARDEVGKNRPFESAAAEESFKSLVGRHYSKFVDDVNGAMEDRDKELTVLFNQHQNALSDLRRHNQFKVQMAHEEHALLTKTIRDRLIQNVTQKRAKLLKDKEQLDIADSNALLLNPTQFSIGNPTASPGGGQNRKTRNTRFRPGDAGTVVEDSTAAAVATAPDNKRKRKAAFDDDNGSPGPATRTLIETNGGTATPSRDAKQKLFHQQFEAPLYSIESLFSDRELLLNSQRAHNATNEHFERLRTQGIETRLHAATLHAATGKGKATTGSTNGGPTSGSNNNISTNDTAMPDADDNERPTANPDGNKPHTSPSPPSAPSSYHATRSTNRTATQSHNAAHNPLNDLADTAAATTSTAGLPFTSSAAAAAGTTKPSAAAATGGPTSHFSPYGVAFQGAAAVKANSQAPPPPAASDAEVQADLAAMRRGHTDTGYEELVKRSLEKPGFGIGAGEGGFSGSAVRSTLVGVGNDTGESVEAGGGGGGVVMGRQGSGMGFFGGGVGMERQGSGMGLAGVMMSKSSSLQGVAGYLG